MRIGIDRNEARSRRLIPWQQSARWLSRDVRFLRARSGADLDECERWAARMRANAKQRRVCAGIASGLGTLGLLYIIGFGPPGGNGLAGPALDWMERTFGHRPWFDVGQTIAALLVWFGPCIAWGLFCEFRILRGGVCKDIDYAVRRPLCLGCGYDCAGLPRDGNRVMCPECGERTPAIMPPETP